jgi:hypothetical protein
MNWQDRSIRHIIDSKGITVNIPRIGIDNIYCISPAIISLFIVLSFGIASATGTNEATEKDFLKENEVAMNKMMSGMDVKPTGLVDRDFAEMMIPHHQGAIDMAQAELRYGHNEQLRRIAQEIIVEQQQEITAMRLALQQPLPAASPAPDQIKAR